jgi:subtilisin family serine protease
MTRLLRIGAALAAVLLLAAAAGGRDNAAAPTAAQKSERMPGELVVKFRPGVDEARKAAIRAAFAATRLRATPGGLERWRLPEGASVAAAVAALSAEPDIDFAEPNYLYQPHAAPNDPLFAELWFLENRGQVVKGFAGTPGADIAAPAAWDRETGDPEMIVAVIDSGVAFDHPDLAGNVWSNAREISGNERDDDGNGYVDDQHGWDFVNDDANPSDYSRDLAGDGHGTHVAGTIAARGDNGRGITGVMWRGRIMALQVFDLFESSSFFDAFIQNFNIAAALEYAVANGARIINCSFGGPSFSQAQFQAISNADRAGVLVVCAAGNASQNIDRSPSYPAAYDLPNIISVAATDERDRLSSYSNFGAASVDVAAPGGNGGFNIFSTIPPERETLFFEDFESGLFRWEQGGTSREWSVAFDPRFGSLVALDSVGEYDNNEDTYIQTQSAIDAEGYRGLHIQFRSAFELEENFDFLVVEGSTDGINFSTEFPVTGFLTGFSSGVENILAWESDRDLGGPFYLRFRLDTDESITFDGAAVDDITLTGIRWEFTGDEYDFKSGTSMAAPVVAGVAGLVWSHRPALSHLEVKNAVLNGVELLPGLDGVVRSGGRVNADLALDAATEDLAPAPAPDDSEDGGGGGCFLRAIWK